LQVFVRKVAKLESTRKKWVLTQKCKNAPSQKIILGGSLLQNEERKRENNVLSAESVYQIH